MIFPHPHLNNLPGRPATPRQHLAYARRGTHGFAETVVAERLPLGDGEADIAADAQLYGPIFLGNGVQIKSRAIVRGPMMGAVTPGWSFTQR